MQATSQPALTDFAVELLCADHLTSDQRAAAAQAFRQHLVDHFGTPVAAMTAWAALQHAIEAGLYRSADMPQEWSKAQRAACDAALAGLDRRDAVFWCSFFEGVDERPVQAPAVVWPPSKAPF